MVIRKHSLSKILCFEIQKQIIFSPKIAGGHSFIYSSLNQSIMKIALVFTAFAAICLLSSRLSAQSNNGDTAKNLYMDVHHLGPGKVTYKAVAAAHKKDLAVEGKYGVHFINYW